MKKKGFTLIELLAVIIVLGLLSTIAFVSITRVQKTIQNNILEKKITMIEEAAVLKGEDIKGSIINSDKHYDNYPCKSFIVSDLVPDYLDKDNDSDCLTLSSSAITGCIVDPTNNSNYLDRLEVIVYYKNKRMHAKVDKDKNLSCS